MSKVIEFPSYERAYRRRKEQEEREERIRREGGAVNANLKSWHVSIPMPDRKQMALNMEAILVNYKLSSSDLPWQDDYRSREDFFRLRIKQDQWRLHLSAMGENEFHPARMPFSPLYNEGLSIIRKRRLSIYRGTAQETALREKNTNPLR